MRAKQREWYTQVWDESRQRYNYRHILVVEGVLGKQLPVQATVHHIDGSKENDSNTNLVACEDAGYHNHLHRRERALDACGHAGWYRCRYCHTWDAPENLTIIPAYDRFAAVAYHKPCAAEYQANLNARRR